LTTKTSYASLHANICTLLFTREVATSRPAVDMLDQSDRKLEDKFIELSASSLQPALQEVAQNAPSRHPWTPRSSLSSSAAGRLASPYSTNK
jgi:hypothetical protein